MSHHITISWSPSPGPVSGYNVYRGSARGNESKVPLNSVPVTATTFEDDAVFPGQTYSYAVTAVLNGVESVDSIDIVAPPIPFPDPPAPLDLTFASSFDVLAGSTITNTGPSLINGDVGVSPGTNITGMGAPAAISGVFHPGDFVSAGAQSALGQAFTAGMALTGATALLGDIGGQRLFPGLYAASSSLGITGILMLDAQGNPNAFWVFQIGSTLTTAASNSAVVMLGGGQAANVFWLVGSSATLGTNTAFAGTIMAQASITATTGAAVNGKLLARTGAVTLDNNEIMSFQSTVLHGPPPSPPNVPPAPPPAPMNLLISSES